MGWYYQPIGGRSTADKDRFLRSEIEHIADKPRAHMGGNRVNRNFQHKTDPGLGV